MYEEFRQQAEQSFFDDDPDEEAFESYSDTILRKRSLFGLSPAQRCVLMLMLFGLTIMLSSLCLLVTEKITPF